MKKILSALICGFFLSALICVVYAETTFEPFVGYNAFQKIGPVNRLIDNYSEIFFPAQYSEIKGGWDYGGKLGIGLIKDKLMITAKVSYLMAATGMIYTNLWGGTISQGDLEFLLGYPDNFKIRLLKGQVGLDFIPIQKQKVAVGLSASTGPGFSRFIVKGSGLFYDGTSSHTYTYSIPYEKQANVFDVALNVEFKPFGSEKTSSFGTETEPFPLRSTSIELSVGSSFAPIGAVESTRNIDFWGDGMDVGDIKKGDTLKKTYINVGDDLKLDLSSIFINLGIKLRW